MSRLGRSLIAGGLLACLFLLTALFFASASRRAPATSRPPELAGQQVPARVYEIRFDQKCDLYCAFFRDEPTVYRNCKVLGFTGREEGSTRAERGSPSSGFAFSSGSWSGSYSGRRYFDHWLVVELSDGRLAYVPPTAVRYIEEASPAGE